MDPNEIPSGVCQETAGFLFSHPCGDVAVRECADCQKAICQRHSIDSGGVMRCVSCERNLRDQQRSTGNTGNRNNQDDDSSPYFYGTGYGYGYGYGTGSSWGHGHRSRHFSSWHTQPTHHNLNDADESALEGGETSADDVRGFENDMGAS